MLPTFPRCLMAVALAGFASQSLAAAPVLVSDRVVIFQGAGQQTIDVLANDSDADPGDTLTVTAVGPAIAGGTVSVEGNVVRYTPPSASFVGRDAFRYIVTDGRFFRGSSVAVIVSNSAPIARSDRFSLVEGLTNFNLDVLANDVDRGGGTLSLASVGTPSGGGSASIVGNQIQYTPPSVDFVGREFISYTVTDGQFSTQGTAVALVNRDVSTFTLNLIHAADMEGAGDAVEDAPRFSAVLDALRSASPANSLVLSSGDNYIPGPFFSASNDVSLVPLLGGLGNGSADVQMLNAMGFQASAMGNHEFDEGTVRIRDLIRPRSVDADSDGDLDSYPGQLFPYITANLSFSGDANLASAVTAPRLPPLPGTISRSTVITVAGQRIGIVGATTPTLPIISSPGAGVVVTPQPFAGTPTPEQLDALAAIIQAEVNALVATGLNKVILVAHMQVLNIERQLATRLRNVDIIVAGGSDSILADATDRLRAGDTAVDVYPILTVGADGLPTAIVNTDGQYKYVGQLRVGFNGAGILRASSIDAAVSGAYATDAQGVTEVNGTPIPRVTEIATAIGNILIAREGNILGQSSVFLNGARSGLRGNGASFGGVRTEETNFGNLTADANLFAGAGAAIPPVVSLKNGGGIRNFIGQVVQPAGSTNPLEAQLLPPAELVNAGKEFGDVSQFDVQNALSFNNALSLVTISATVLKDLLEHGISGTIASANGRFPQIGGMRFGYDETRTSRTAVGNGQRICSLVVETPTGDDVVVANGALVGDPSRVFRMVTLSFLLTGGDGYPFAGNLNNRVDLNVPAQRTGAAIFADDGTEQDAVAEFLLANFNGTPYADADTVAAGDTRIFRTTCP